MSKFEFKFIPRDKDAELVIPAPRPAKSFYPEYLKRMPNNWVNGRGESEPYASQCMPFTDSFVTGYIQELACDIEFTRQPDGSAVYRWGGGIRPLSTRFEDEFSPNHFPKFPGFDHADYHWNTFWEPQTPPGYSTLYTHPHNRFDLPFFTFSAVTDTDNWPFAGPIPFLLKEGFEGVIPAGTPIIQMTFIKRDEWHSSTAKYDAEFDRKAQYPLRKFLRGGYKALYWNKKTYL